MRKLFTFIAFFFCLLFAGQALAADTTYYLRSDGTATTINLATSCGAVGTAMNPTDFNTPGNWSSIDAADKIDPGDTVEVCRNGVAPVRWTTGDYVLGYQGEGTSGKNVWLQGETAGSGPHVQGSVAVSGTWTHEGSNVWSYDTTISTKIWAVFDNTGAWLMLAHEPDGAWFTVDGTPDNVDEVDIDGVGETLPSPTTWSTCSSPSASNVCGADIICHNRDWWFNGATISAYSASTDVVSLSNDMPFGRVPPESDDRCGGNNSPNAEYYITNKKSFLDTQDEWFWDDSDDTLYVYSTSMPTGTWEATVAETVIYAERKDYIRIKDLNVRHAWKAGIHLSYYNEPGTEFGIDDGQVDYIGTQLHDAASGANKSIGIWLQSQQGAEEATAYVDGTTVDNVIAKGIYVSHMRSPSSPRNAIQNTTVSNIGLFGGDGGNFMQPHSYTSSAIAFNGGAARYWHVYRNTINDVITNGIYTGVYSLVEENDITNCMQDSELGDMGCIYFWADKEGSNVTVLNNDVDSNMVGTLNVRAGIYMDGGASNNTITGNTIKGAEWGILSNTGTDQTITDNTICDFYEWGIYIAEKTWYNPSLPGTECFLVRNIVMTGNKISGRAGFEYHVHLASFCDGYGYHDPIDDFFATCDADDCDADNNTYYPDGLYLRERYLHPGGGSNDMNLATWKDERDNFEENSSIAPISESPLCCTPNKPSVSSPSGADVSVQTSIVSSAYSKDASCSETHTGSDWEVCDDGSCISKDRYSYDDTTNKTTIVYNAAQWTGGGEYDPATTFYSKVRHYNSAGDSEWSDAIGFTTGGAPAGGAGALYIFKGGTGQVESTPTISGGNTYYVASGGSGTDCSAYVPCTLAYACQTKANPSDWIVIQDTISATVDCSANDGTSGNEITIVDRKRLTGTVTLGDYYDLYCANSLAGLVQGTNDRIYPCGTLYFD